MKTETVYTMEIQMQTKPDEAVNGQIVWAGHVGKQIDGLTKREYFAACALQGIMASDQLEVRNSEAPTAAKVAVKLADELIRALNGESND